MIQKCHVTLIAVGLIFLACVFISHTKDSDTSDPIFTENHCAYGSTTWQYWACTGSAKGWFYGTNNDSSNHYGNFTGKWFTCTNQNKDFFEISNEDYRECIPYCQQWQYPWCQPYTGAAGGCYRFFNRRTRSVEPGFEACSKWNYEKWGERNRCGTDRTGARTECKRRRKGPPSRNVQGSRGKRNQKQE